MKECPIGIFDSGIGGLTVAHKIKESLPNESIIYFGDTQHLPYGEKSEKLITEFSLKITEFLIKKKCKVIIIACNSASSIAYKSVKNLAKSIPVFNVIDPVTNMISADPRYVNIGVIGTKATITSNIYSNKILKRDPGKNIYSLSTPLLAPMIEENFIKDKIREGIIENYLSNPILKNIDSLILGCTHYPLILNEISSFYNDQVKVIESDHILSKFISNQLEKLSLKNLNSKVTYDFYVSDYTKSFEKSAKYFFKENINLTEIKIHI